MMPSAPRTWASRVRRVELVQLDALAIRRPQHRERGSDVSEPYEAPDSGAEQQISSEPAALLPRRAPAKGRSQ